MIDLIIQLMRSNVQVRGYKTVFKCSRVCAQHKCWARQGAVGMGIQRENPDKAKAVRHAMRVCVRSCRA